MEHPRDVSRLELLGGDPALDFANTLEGPRGERSLVDWLPDYAALVSWSVRAALLDAEAAEDLRTLSGRRRSAAAVAHRDAVRLRAALGDIFGALAAGDRAPQASLAALLRAHHAALAHAALAPTAGRYAVTWPPSGLGRPWWPVAQAAVDLLRSDRLPRLKGCGRCSWLFLDQTKNRSRRWCSMADCGTAEKLRRRAAARVAQ
jgi:predicted RNA-binding Zn ribbon-like protein